MSSRSHPHGFSFFSALVWAVFLAIAIYLLAWPPLQGMWAERSWKKVPCHLAIKVTGGGDQFFFEYNGLRYYSYRITFWQLRNSEPALATGDALFVSNNAQCYVRENAQGRPGMAVLNPTGGPGGGVFIDRIGILILALAACIGVEFQSRRGRGSAKAPFSPLPDKAP